ncbi:MAG: ROK family protein [Acidobacteriota bacterium]|nr:ROK family protein [Acidobacteriota bacterium]
MAGDSIEEGVGEQPLSLGVDIGGTKVAAGAMSANAMAGGALFGWSSAESRPDLEPAAMVVEVVRQVEQLLESLGRSRDEVVGLGIGFPGDFDPLSGVLKTAPNLPAWIGTSPRELFSTCLQRRWECEVPVAAENDACVAALAEARLGTGRGVQRMLYITVSTGVGGARYDSGAVRNIEPGLYTFPDPAQPEINLESLASGPATAAHARREIRAYVDRHGLEQLQQLTSVFSTEEGPAPATREQLEELLAQLTARHLGQAASRGDTFSRGLFDRSAHILAAGLAILLDQGFGEQRIVIGGSVAAKTPGYVDQVRQELARRQALSGASQALRSFDPLQIVEAGLGDERGVLGAASLVADLQTPRTSSRLAGS